MQIKHDEEKELIRKLVVLQGDKFHGSITIQCANGVPKKLEIRRVDDL